MIKLKNIMNIHSIINYLITIIDELMEISNYCFIIWLECKLYWHFAYKCKIKNKFMYLLCGWNGKNEIHGVKSISILIDSF